ncbi:MAG: LysM peptidoglycan-binding domain-containing protein [Phocaeicola sp.]|nr:LysM peptidoglycan-binding domain-containing protein [Phocaeicola sp.]
MKSVRIFYLFLLLAFLPFCSFAQTQTGEGYFLHTITKGQSLYSIASMYHVTVDEIIKLNPGSEEIIREGKTLKIPQTKTSGTPRFHTIQSGETLYRLTVKYNVPASTIMQANPGLSASNFRAGQVIVIPPSSGQTYQETETPKPEVSQIDPSKKWQDMHKVKKGETIFSISRQYNITEEELIAANPEIKKGKLKKGSFLAIPYHVDPKAAVEKKDPSNDELFNENKQEVKRLATIKAAIVLPFGTKGQLSQNDKIRMVEYYRGVLMACDTLKRKGVSLDIYTYDSGSTTASIKAILNKSEMKKMDIIFGPSHLEQIKPLSDFAKEHHIRLVIPFTSKDKEVFSNPYIYLINTPQSYLYSEVFDHFLKQFKQPNVVFLDANDAEKSKSEFVKELKNFLSLHQVRYSELRSDNITSEVLQSKVDSTKTNVFIPTSGSNVALIKLLPQLIVLTRDHPTYKVNFFGYPEWQTYTKDHLNEFFEMDSYFYSSFYTNNLFPESIKFSASYRRWFGKDMANTYPKYGMLGFDTAYFLLNGLSRYGSDLENNLNKQNIVPIQTGFKFERVNNWGGFINKKVFFVHFTKEGELVKIDFE